MESESTLSQITLSVRSIAGKVDAAEPFNVLRGCLSCDILPLTLGTRTHCSWALLWINLTSLTAPGIAELSGAFGWLVRNSPETSWYIGRRRSSLSGQRSESQGGTGVCCGVFDPKAEAGRSPFCSARISTAEGTCLVLTFTISNVGGFELLHLKPLNTERYTALIVHLLNRCPAPHPPA